MLGPLFVHYHKMFRKYNYFCSSLIGLQQGVSNIQAVGTDGEKALVEALAQNFPHASQLRCFRHLQQNIEAHLRDKHFPTSTALKYVHEIFGWTDHDGCRHKGLVDCFNAEAFDTQLKSLEESWNDREVAAFADRLAYVPEFHAWFVKYKAEEFCLHTLRSLREDVGLGCPPSAFYTNDNESINATLKERVDYRKQQWAIFNRKMMAAVEVQQREVEKAIIACGQYRLRSRYSFLVVPEKWFRMTSAQREHHTAKLNKCRVRGSQATIEPSDKTTQQWLRT